MPRDSSIEGLGLGRLAGGTKSGEKCVREEGLSSSRYSWKERIAFFRLLSFCKQGDRTENSWTSLKDDGVNSVPSWGTSDGLGAREIPSTFGKGIDNAEAANF